MLEEMRQELLQNTKENLQPMKQFVTSIIATPIVALVMSAIMAFFVRKNPKYKEII